MTSVDPQTLYISDGSCGMFWMAAGFGGLWDPWVTLVGTQGQASRPSATEGPEPLHLQPRKAADDRKAKLPVQPGASLA